MKYAGVIVDISLQKLDRVFNYAVPEALQPETASGVRVRVPFGGRELTGYVLEVSDTTKLPASKIKSIISI
ncbi:MAG: hypothetical protein IKR26_02635, partial [Lachnospiraceae bacterium]|nr:hypothetical protein [Lachnospiraceae bacterium]